MRYDDWDVLLFPSGRDDRVPVKEFKPGSYFHISVHSWCTPQISQYTLNYSKHPDLVRFEARILIDGRMVASTSFNPLGPWPQLITSSCEMSKQGELEPLKFPSFRRELLYQNHWNPADDTGRIKIIISEGFPRDSPSNPIERVKNVVVFSFQHAPLDILETNGIAWPNPQMWRRPQNNPSLPVPTYYPDGGADSHLHSPRRRSYVGRGTAGSGVATPVVTPSLTASSGSAMTYTSFPQAMPTFQKSSGSSSSGFMEPIGEAAYQQWVGSLGLLPQQHTVEPKAIWPSTTARNSGKQLQIDTCMPNISDYLSSTMGQGIGSDLMNLSGPGLDDDCNMESLKVPTNTPTTWMGVNSAGSGQLDLDIPDTAISGELASSLTHSLLNQPHPLNSATQPHQIPLPASDVRSRKENRHLNHVGSVHSPSSSNPSPSVEAQIRKFSQPGNAFGVISHDRDSSGAGPAYSRRTSAGEFGANITNQATPGQTYVGVATSASAPGSGSEKGTKRGRNFTPASAKAIDEEDEPRRLSPRMRITAVPMSNEEQTQIGE